MHFRRDLSTDSESTQGGEYESTARVALAPLYHGVLQDGNAQEKRKVGTGDVAAHAMRRAQTLHGRCMSDGDSICEVSRLGGGASRKPQGPSRDSGDAKDILGNPHAGMKGTHLQSMRRR